MDKGSLILVVGHFKDEFFKLDSCLKNEGFWIKQVKSFSQLREKHIPSPALILFDVDKPQKAHIKTLKGLQEK